MNLTKIKVQIEKGNKVQEEHGKVDATSKKKQFLRPRCEIAVKNKKPYSRLEIVNSDFKVEFYFHK